MRPVVVWITFVTLISALDADLVDGLLHHHHRAVVEVAHRLAVLAPLLHQPHRDLVPGRVRHAELRRQGVDLRDRHAKGLGHLRQVVVDGDQRRATLAGEAHQRGIDVEHAGLLDELELDRRGLLQLDQHVEALGVLAGAGVGPRNR